MSFSYVINTEEIPVPADFKRISGHLNEYTKAMINTEEDAEKAKSKMTIPLGADSRVTSANVHNIFRFLEVYKENDKDAYEADLDMLEKNSEEKRINTLPAWAKDFFDGIEKEELFTTMNAANYLIVRPFVRYSTLYVARKIEDMSVVEMRVYLNSPADFSDEEWNELKREPCWNELMRKEGLIPESEAVLATEAQ